MRRGVRKSSVTLIRRNTDSSTPILSLSNDSDVKSDGKLSPHTFSSQNTKVSDWKCIYALNLSALKHYETYTIQMRTKRNVLSLHSNHLFVVMSKPIVLIKYKLLDLDLKLYTNLYPYRNLNRFSSFFTVKLTMKTRFVFMTHKKKNGVGNEWKFTWLHFFVELNNCWGGWYIIDRYFPSEFSHAEKKYVDSVQWTRN